MLNQKKKAFTLIELLVVIAIIGILATLAVVALQQARQNARDSKRMADMKQVHTALELFYSENNRYPTGDEWSSGTIISSSSQEVFMYTIPSAPTPADGDCQPASNTYTYIPAVDGSTYTIDFCTGKQVSDLPAGSKQMTPGGIILASSGTGGGEGGGVTSCSVYTSGNGECEYGGQTYQIVQIGTQTWFAENLNYDNGCSSVTRITGVDNGFCGCYDDNPLNCDTYGIVYQWSLTQENICPNGWRVSTNNDWSGLKGYLGTQGHSGTEGLVLKASSPTWNGSDLYNFKVLPGGCEGAWGGFAGDASCFWTSDSDSGFGVFNNFFTSWDNIANFTDGYHWPYSIRCIKE